MDKGMIVTIDFEQIAQRAAEIVLESMPKPPAPYLKCSQAAKILGVRAELLTLLCCQGKVRDAFKLSDRINSPWMAKLEAYEDAIKGK